MNERVELEQRIEQAMKDYNLYGRSFTHGVALYEIARNWGKVPEEVEEMIIDCAIAQYGMTQGTDDLDLRGCIEILDIATLDDIVTEYLNEVFEIEYCASREEAQEQAKEYMEWVSENDLSYGELTSYTEEFEKLARQFDLVEEFKENGVI